MSSQGDRADRWKRRLVSVPVVVISFFLYSLLLIPLLVLGALIDAVRSLLRGIPWVVTRSLLFGWFYLVGELVGVSRMALIYLTSPTKATRMARTYRLQYWWADFLLGAVSKLFQLDFRIEGDEVVTPGPVLVFVRHASIVDTLIPLHVIRPHGLVLRYVLKRELLVDPALDIAGHAIPNYFVARGGSDADAEVARVGELAEGLGRGEGMVIYPEGTRFTPAKQKRFREKLAETNPELSRLGSGLRHTLPPRVGGPLAMLNAAPDADVVFIAHYGLDGFAEVKDMKDGVVIGRPVTVKVWRVPRSEIPVSDAGRTEWLYEQWQDLDDWVEVVKSERSSAG